MPLPRKIVKHYVAWDVIQWILEATNTRKDVSFFYHFEFQQIKSEKNFKAKLKSTLTSFDLCTFNKQMLHVCLWATTLHVQEHFTFLCVIASGYIHTFSTYFRIISPLITQLQSITSTQIWINQESKQVF